MQRKADELKAAMSDFSGPQSEFRKMQDEARQLDDAINKLATNGAKNAQDAIVNLSEKAGQALSSGNFDTSSITKNLSDTTNAATAFANAWLKTMDDATSKDLGAMLENNKSQLQAITAEIVKTQDAVDRTNNPAVTAALNNQLRALFQAVDYYEQLDSIIVKTRDDLNTPAQPAPVAASEEELTRSNEILATEERRQQVIQQMTSLLQAHAAQIDKLNDDIGKSEALLAMYKQEYVSLLSQKGNMPLREYNQQAAMLKEKIASTSLAVQSMTAQMDSSSNKAESLRGELNGVKENTQLTVQQANELSAKYDETGQGAMRLRTQMMMCREAMARMIENGETGSMQFVQMAEQAGKLRQEFTLASAKMNFYANPNKKLAVTAAGLKGLAGIAKVATGVFGLFVKKQEDLAKIQTTIQSLIAINMGVTSAYQLLQKKGAVIQGIQYLQEKLRKKAIVDLTVAQEMQSVSEVTNAGAVTVDTGAKTANTAATQGMTVAQRIFNAVANANPYVILATALLGVVSAVVLLAKANSDATKKEEERKKAAEDRKKQEEDFANTFSSSAAGQVSKYMELRRQWRALKTEQEKNKFIHDNQQAFHDLGYAVNSVSSAENFLVRHTSSVVKAFELRAKAAALLSMQQEAYSKYYKAIAANEQAIGKGKYIPVKAGQAVPSKYLSNLRKGTDYTGGDASNPDPQTNLVFYTPTELTAVGAARVNAMQNAAAWSAWKASNAKYGKELDKTNRFVDRELGKVDKELKALDTGTSPYHGDEGGHNGGGRGSSGSAGGRDTTSKDNSTRAAEDEYSSKLQEKEEKRRQQIEDERKLEAMRIEAMEDGRKKARLKREAENRKELEDIKEEYRQRVLEIIKDERDSWDKAEEAEAKRTKGYTPKNYYKSDKFKAHFDEKGEIVLPAELQDQQDQLLAFAQISQRNKENAEQANALKDLEKYFDVRLKIEHKYEEERRKLQEDYEAGLIDEDVFHKLAGYTDERGERHKGELDSQKEAELGKAAFSDFKNSPLFQMAMQNTGVDFDAMQRAYDAMSAKMSEAAKTMNPADFKAYSDAFSQLSDKMIDKQPFTMLKKSVEELKKAEDEYKIAHEATAKVYKKYGLDEFGQIDRGASYDENGNAKNGTLAKLQEDDKRAQEALASAQKEAAAAQDEKSLKEATDKVNKARKEATRTALELSAATNEIAKAQNKESASETRVQNATVKQQKSTKRIIDLTKQWAEAVKTAAGMFQSPIATAIASMAGLASTTIDSINAIKDAGKSSAEGVDKVAMAVTKAVAILAIIQAAWQVINTIMGLFSGSEEKKYEEKVSSLRGQINSLDYAFNNLKEDMDKTWGTEAIDNYSKAVDQLNEKQAKQLDLIRLQAGAHIGHHSLNYYFDKKSGLTDSDWQQAYQWAIQQGYDISGTKTDFLYNMTPEQLKAFMSSGIGSYIMGALGGVKGTGDYSGSDWYSDMQSYANTAKDMEDLTDDLQAKLNGISFDALKDNLKDLVTSFGMSMNDINNDFDKIMREATYNNVRTGYENSLKGWYKELDELNKKRAEGMSADDYKKQLALLKEKYGNIVKTAQNEYQETLTEAGINVKDVEQSATSGGFETMSEDTGTELNGRFAAMQSQETITAENSSKLVTLTGGIYNIADEIRTIQVNSYLELKAITENTGKVVEPILEMQENIKKIKDNTDSL